MLGLRQGYARRADYAKASSKKAKVVMPDGVVIENEQAPHRVADCHLILSLKLISSLSLNLIRSATRLPGVAEFSSITPDEDLPKHFVKSVFFNSPGLSVTCIESTSTDLE